MNIFFATRGEKIIANLRYQTIMSYGHFPHHSCIWMEVEKEDNKELYEKLKGKLFPETEIPLICSTILREELFWDRNDEVLLVFGEPKELIVYINRIRKIAEETLPVFDPDPVPDDLLYKVECFTTTENGVKKLQTRALGLLFPEEEPESLGTVK